MAEKVIGILGGMGPEATLRCFAHILAQTPAQSDQEHLRVIIDDNPKIPDRTRAILGQGPSPLPALLESCRALERAGADFIIIPCVTAHFFLQELMAQSPLPVVSLLEVVGRAVAQARPPIRKVGLLGTNGTVQSGIFQKELEARGIETLVCEPQRQEQVMEAIYLVKSSQQPGDRRRAAGLLAGAADHLLERGAQGVVAGCTEIPLALEPGQVAAPYFDSLRLLAREAIRLAGREPRSV